MIFSLARRMCAPAAALILLSACSEPEEQLLLDPVNPGNSQCSVNTSLIFNGGPGKDGIPALTDPALVDAGGAGSEYLRDEDRVIGLVVEEQAIAVPLNIGWWHEIVNLNVGSVRLAVTHCPLTGSSLAFDRAAVGGAEFGVSGLLFMNNLIMYDRTTQESLWPQMTRGARCGPRDGTALAMYPVVEMSWAGWRTLHPATRVISSSTGFRRNYAAYPYGSYDQPANGELLFPMPSIDGRRLPKERVLGIPADGSAAIAFPFSALDALGAVAAVHDGTLDDGVVVFWDRAAQAAAAFRPRAGERALTFEVAGGALRDRETGSSWRVDGLATDGPLSGTRLQPVAEAYVAFWFAWAAFHSDTRLWIG